MKRSATAYALLFKNDKRKQYDGIALFTILINLGLFIYIFLNAGVPFVQWSAGIGAIMICISLAIEWTLKPARSMPGQPFRYAGIYLIFIFWLLLSNWWAAACCLLVSLLYLAAKRPLLAYFSPEYISYPSFPRRIIYWTEVDTVVMRAGLLTINLRNDHFYQPDLEVAEVSEDEFNRFCLEQINADRSDSLSGNARG